MGFASVSTPFNTPQVGPALPLPLAQTIEREVQALRPLLPNFDAEGRGTRLPAPEVGRCSRAACSIQRYLDAADRIPPVHAFLLREWAAGRLDTAARRIDLPLPAAKQCVHRANLALTSLLASMPLY